MIPVARSAAAAPTVLALAALVPVAPVAVTVPVAIAVPVLLAVPVLFTVPVPVAILVLLLQRQGARSVAALSKRREEGRATRIRRAPHCKPAQFNCRMQDVDATVCTLIASRLEVGQVLVGL